MHEPFAVTNVDMMATLTLQKEVILCEKVKQHPVLFDKQLEGYRCCDQYMECSGKRNRNREVFIVLTQKN